MSEKGANLALALSDTTLRRRIVGKVIRRARVDAGLTQKDVADALEYSTPQFISNWERGVSLPPAKAARTLAKVLRMSPKVIVDALCLHQERATARYRKNLLKEMG